MSIGQKIYDRRTQLGMSQEELAKKMGYKTRSSINKIELGLSDIPQKKIVQFAAALDTTVQYLMGWEETAPAPDPLEEKRQRLIGELGKLSEEDILKVLEYAKFITRDK